MNIRLLSLGDEYSANAQRYLVKIAKCDGIDITAGNLILSGGDLMKHRDSILNDEPVYRFEFNERGSVRTDVIENCSPGRAFEWDRWNYITIQQEAGKAGISETFFPYICDIADVLREKCPKASLVLNEVWAFSEDCGHESFSLYDNSQKKMAEMIRGAYIEAAEKTGINIVFPLGEAWQRARSTKIGDNLTADGCHANRMGEFLSSAVWYEILTENDVTKNSYRLPFVPTEHVKILKEIAHEISKEYSLHKAIR